MVDRTHLEIGHTGARPEGLASARVAKTANRDDRCKR